MHGRRQYTLKGIQTEYCGSKEGEAVNTKVEAIEGFTEELGLEE